MESLDTWKLVNSGQAKAEMTLTTDRFRDGSQSLRLRTRTTGDTPVPTSRYYGSASVVRTVSNEDWSAFNRISLWLYPDLPGFRVVSILLVFHNAGAEKSPDVYGKMGMNYVLLNNHQWNHVVWEIPNLGRDKVTGLEIRYMLQGHEPGASDIATFDIDQLELQKVASDHYEGWSVAPGEIAYSHSGYQTGAVKRAIASGLAARSFDVISTAGNRSILTRPIGTVKSRTGDYQTLDFSEVTAPGTYYLRAGRLATKPFPIGDDVWKSSIRKAINFYYAERCGYRVPGVHDECHRDWLLKHGDKTIIANGGWHDAGDLSQSHTNTAESAYAMLKLAERLNDRKEEPELAAELLAEARWGLDWLLRTRFGDGFRPTFSTLDRWTDGIIGNTDDMVAQAGNNPAGNFQGASVEALASRLLKTSDATAARMSLEAAEQDFQFALTAMASAGAGGSRRGSAVELAAHGAIAAVELWRATGKDVYADKAFEFARTITASQQRGFLPGLNERLAGFFYTGPDKQSVLRYSHVSHEGEPVTALALLCSHFPNHRDWMNWYAAVTLYSDYYQAPMAAYSAPFNMLASSIHSDEEYLKAPLSGRGASRNSYRAQVLNGVRVGEHHYVRLFPVWFEFRGNHGTLLTEATAVSSASTLRRSPALSALAQQQLEWVVGRNPFAQSTMWGEGHNYAPQYSAMSGDLVGSLPVGIQTHGDGDAPYWPTENCHNWKEVWVFPVARWFALMRDLSGPALVEGTAPAPVEFRNTRTNTVRRIAPDRAGRYRVTLPQGDYVASSLGASKHVTLLPGSTHSVALGANFIDTSLASTTEPDGSITLTATVRGAGHHSLAVRSSNLELAEAERSFDLKPGVPLTLRWKGRLTSADAPWIAVVVADGEINQRAEATGYGRTTEPSSARSVR